MNSGVRPAACAQRRAQSPERSAERSGLPALGAGREREPGAPVPGAQTKAQSAKRTKAKAKPQPQPSAPRSPQSDRALFQKYRTRPWGMHFVKNLWAVGKGTTSSTPTPTRENRGTIFRFAAVSTESFCAPLSCCCGKLFQSLVPPLESVRAGDLVWQIGGDG
jgi:hypothetical protein